MSSWGRSACYPRRTFYPLSDGPSIQNHRITIPWFPTCSTRRSHSQACLYYCTPHTVTKRVEQTFGSLRYTFGGDHPSQTTHHARSPTFVGLDPRPAKGGISTLAPSCLATQLHSLPPILHIPDPKTMQRYSKGARGLSVLPQQTSIFTRISISPGLWLRQRGSRYAIRAGRNLPDKEFRYLRMVIVTTAVYWGLNSQLRLTANRSS